MGNRPGADLRAGQQNARIFRRDGWKCVYCGYDGDGPEKFVFLELDHIDLQTKTNDDYNEEHDLEKATACRRCNGLMGSYRPNGVTRDEKIADKTEKIIRPAQKKDAKWYNRAKHDTQGCQIS